jgi:hypothetical protein
MTTIRGKPKKCVPKPIMTVGTLTLVMLENGAIYKVRKLQVDLHGKEFSVEYTGNLPREVFIDTGPNRVFNYLDFKHAWGELPPIVKILS